MKIDASWECPGHTCSTSVSEFAMCGRTKITLATGLTASLISFIFLWVEKSDLYSVQHRMCQPHLNPHTYSVLQTFLKYPFFRGITNAHYRYAVFIYIYKSPFEESLLWQLDLWSSATHCDLGLSPRCGWTDSTRHDFLVGNAWEDFPHANACSTKSIFGWIPGSINPVP